MQKIKWTDRIKLRILETRIQHLQMALVVTNDAVVKGAIIIKIKDCERAIEKILEKYKKGGDKNGEKE